MDELNIGATDPETVDRLKKEKPTSFVDIYESSKNWTEDYPHENGNYINICKICGDHFIGHKRRIVCKECFTTWNISEK